MEWFVILIICVISVGLCYHISESLGDPHLGGSVGLMLFLTLILLWIMIGAGMNPEYKDKVY